MSDATCVTSALPLSFTLPHPVTAKRLQEVVAASFLYDFEQEPASFPVFSMMNTITANTVAGYPLKACGYDAVVVIWGDSLRGNVNQYTNSHPVIHACAGIQY